MFKGIKKKIARVLALVMVVALSVNTFSADAEAAMTRQSDIHTGELSDGINRLNKKTSVKKKLDNGLICTNAGTAKTEDAIKKAVLSYATNTAGSASSVSDAYSPGNFTVSIFESEFVAPVDGTLLNPEGTDGSYKYSLLYRWKQNKDYLNYSTALGARANGITRPYIFAMYIPGVTNANDTSKASVNTIIIPAKSYCEANGHISEEIETVVTEGTCLVDGIAKIKTVCKVCGKETAPERTVTVKAEGHNCSESWIDDSTTATCTAPGKIKVMGLCADCGEEYVMEESDTELFAHEYELVSHVEPTCEDDGYDVYACSECGDSYTCNIPTYGHVIGSDYEEETIEVAAPMAFSAARMMARSAAPSITQTICSFTCPNCNEKVVENADTFHAHVIENVRITKEPTCKSTGEKIGTCSVCGDEFIETIPMLEHRVEYRVSPTNGNCASLVTANKNSVIACSECNTRIKKKDLGVENNIYNMAIHTGTPARYILSGNECTGIVYYDACSDCISRLNGMSADAVKKAYAASNKSAQTAPATQSHDYVLTNILKETSCADCGVFEFTCSLCGDVLVRHEEPSEHNYLVELSDTATCEADGVKTMKCLGCDATKEIPSAALGHDFGEFVVTVEPTCTVPGNKEAKCSRCGSVKTEEIPVAAHTAGSPVAENEAEGIDCKHFGTYEEAVYCTECGEELSRVQKNTTQAGPHTPGTPANENVVAPGCTTPGSHNEVTRCTECNRILSSYAKTDAATGHNYVQNPSAANLKSAATCTEAAQYYKSCSECGELSSETFTYGSALGHSFTNYVFDNNAGCETDGTKTAVCDHGCGATDTKTAADTAAGHTYGEVSVSFAADGKTATATHECEKCGKAETVNAVVTSKITTAGSCTADEVTTYTATGLGATATKAVVTKKAPGHSLATKTVTENGLGYEVEYCSVCNEEFSKAPLCTHENTSVASTTATCTEDGVKTVVCDDCGYSWTEADSAFGHNYGEVTFAFLADGTSATASRSCENCGETESEDAVVTCTASKTATCTQASEKTYTATGLGASATKTVTGSTNPSNHTGSKRVTGSHTPSTCGAYGSVTYTYDCCGAQTGESVWYDHIDPWCYGGNAEQHYKCGACNATTSKAHQYVNKGHVAATCTEPEGDLMVCYCGHSYVEHTNTDTAPHTVSSWTAVSGKCEKVGYCTECGKSVTEVEHHEDPSSFVTYKAKDCTEQNSVTYNCYCHAEHYYETYGCGPHNFDRSGYSGSKCTGMTRWEECGLCGAQQNVRTVEGTGHSWPTNYETQSAYFAGFTSNGDGTHQTAKRCMNGCNEISLSNHGCSYTISRTDNVKGTCTTPSKTITTYKCKYCGYQYTETVTGALEEHDYSLSGSASGTCTTKASYTYKCQNCSATKTEYGSYGSHNYVYTHISGSCDKVGTCSVCGASTGTVPGAHKKNSATRSVVYASDCRSYNQVYYTCYCGSQTYSESGSKTGPHSYNSKGKCVYCGASKTSSASVMALGMLYADDEFDSCSDAYEDELINALDNGLITEEEYLAALGLTLCDGCVHEHSHELKENVFGDDHKLELKEFEFGKLELPTEDEVIESEDNEFDEVIESEETEVIDENQDEAAQADESEELVEEAEVTEEEIIAEVIEEAEKIEPVDVIDEVIESVVTEEVA